MMYAILGLAWLFIFIAVLLGGRYFGSRPITSWLP